jgi:hypothetical protein
MKYHLMDKAGEPGGGGGGNPDPNPDPEPDHTDWKAKYETLEARLAKLEGGGGEPEPKGDDDDDLITKAKKAREAGDKDKNNSKALESALRFSMGADQWLKDNQTILPSEVSEIFEAANKETYDSPIEKDAALKSGIVQSFFSVQDNLDLLTPGLKNQVQDYLKLTKNGKQEKAQQIYESIFEPTFEMLKRLKKADSLSKGHNPGDDLQDSYKQRLMKLSKKHYIGESKDA